MAALKKQLGIAAWGLLLVLLVVACTDRSKQQTLLNEGPVDTPPGGIQLVAEVQFQGGDTLAQKMFLKFGSIFVTGKPFGLARWDVSVDPENPHLTFAASDRLDQFSPDPPLGGWVVDYFASGALTVLGPYAYTSGLAGMSVIDISRTSLPVEVRRFPMPDQDGGIVQDVAFMYKAMVPHPTLPLIYGFSEQDYLYTIDTSSAPNVRLTSKMAYSSSGNVCCVDGAVAFNNKMFVAMRSRLWVFDIGASGGLSNFKSINTLQATGIAATDRFLYVLHQPTSGVPSGFAAGIYVFDRNGNGIAHLPIYGVISFSPTPDDQHIYAATNDATVGIYRWTIGY